MVRCRDELFDLGQSIDRRVVVAYPTILSSVIEDVSRLYPRPRRALTESLDMRVRQARHLVLVASLLLAACHRPPTRPEALTAIEQNETIQRLREGGIARVAHETLADCRAMYSDDPVIAEMAGDSAWILLSTAGWMDLADVDAPTDPRQKKHCRGILTSKADKSAFLDPQDTTKTPWTSYWVVETSHTKAEVVSDPDANGKDSAVADFEITRERTRIGEVLHQPKWSDEAERLFSTTMTGHFRRYDDGWRLESFEEKK